jgi:hypothetical protein
MPVKISIVQTMWPYRVAGYSSPYPTVADVSTLKKNASAKDPACAFATAPGCATYSRAKDCVHQKVHADGEQHKTGPGKSDHQVIDIARVKSGDVLHRDGVAANRQPIEPSISHRFLGCRAEGRAGASLVFLRRVAMVWR